MSRRYRLLPHVVQQEASGSVRVLCSAGSEAHLAHQSRRLVAQAAGDLGALQQRAGQGSVGLGVGGPHDLGQEHLASVEAEPVNEVLVIVERLQVHEHGPRCVGGIRDVDVARRSAVELVRQPRVNGAKRQNTTLIGVFDLWHVLQHPQELAGRGVCGEGEAAAGGELARTKTALHATHKILRSSICPYNGIVQGFSRGPVPDDGRLSLVCDAHGLDLAAGVALGLEFRHCAIDARLDRGHDLLGVMLVPSNRQRSALAPMAL